MSNINKLDNIIMFSGGKDSTAMLFKMIELDYKIDEIIFFDTGWEFPQMLEHIKKVEKHINRKITILKDIKGFDYYFSEHIKTKGKNIGQKGYAFPDFQNRWCTGLKIQNIKRYLKNRNYIEYQGIASDELYRLDKNKKRKNIKYPMVEWGMTEKQALDYCYSLGFDWDGLYKQFDRVSCWCCPLQNLKELRNLHNNFPELWDRLITMQSKSYRKFRNDYTLAELDKRFSIVQLSFDLL